MLVEDIKVSAFAHVVAACEEQLRRAMLESDVGALNRMLADDLLFTDQSGGVLNKQDDIEAHRTGRLKLVEISVSDQSARYLGSGAVVCLRADLTGFFDGQPFSGAFRYTRIWGTTDVGLQVIAGHCSAIA